VHRFLVIASFVLTILAAFLFKVAERVGTRGLEVKVINVYPWNITADLKCDYNQANKKYKFTYTFNVLPFATTTFPLPRKEGLQTCEVGITYSSHRIKVQGATK
jgi:hypothetical protein